MDWLEYFRRNRSERMIIPWELEVHVKQQLRVPLVRSLQRFQMGERGDGSHLKKVAATMNDDSYVAAISLFVEEEQGHADLMARVLHKLDAPLLKRHWSDGCFRFLCLVSGLRTELMVLLVAEVIAKGYFRGLYEATNDPVLRAVCAQIRQDEEGHIAFHADTLRSLLSTVPRPLRYVILPMWRLFFSGVCLIVAYDHRKLLRATGTPRRAFFVECGRIFDGVSRSVLVVTPATTAEGITPSRVTRRSNLRLREVE
jgi:hypothetical protein